jgi:rare lipoprotein A
MRITTLIICTIITLNTIKANVLHSVSLEEKTLIKARDTIIDKLKIYKTSAHASYYHDKFNGRKTASGTRFDNSKYTAAHKKLKFGTKVKVTNQANGKSVIVVITDRGPFIKPREIDLSKKAFKDIAAPENFGAMQVTISIIDEQ